jgi:endonuclease-3
LIISVQGGFILKKKEKKRIDDVLELLDNTYGLDLYCYLDYEMPWQLLIATILSAQCTDERVNIVTKSLFKKYTTVEAFASADILELEKDIYSTGFYRNKAKNIINCCRKLLEKYNGDVPSEIEKLIELDGVGRKTANVIRGNIYNIQSIVVDTHVKRISNRLGFTKESDPEKIELDLMKVLPEDNWIRYNFQIIKLGREICVARNPKCNVCFLQQQCKYFLDNIKR